MTPTIVPNASELKITSDMTARQVLTVLQKRNSAGLATIKQGDDINPALINEVMVAFGHSPDYHQSYDPDWIYDILKGRLERNEAMMQTGDSFGVHQIMMAMDRLNNHPNIANARVF